MDDSARHVEAQRPFGCRFVGRSIRRCQQFIAEGNEFRQPPRGGILIAPERVHSIGDGGHAEKGCVTRPQAPAGSAATPQLLAMNRGFSLIELLIGLVLLGLLTLMAVPRLAGLRDAAQLRQESLRLVVALDRARGTAVRFASNARLALTDSNYTITVALPDTLLEVWRAPGPGAEAVRLSGTGAPILFGPSGVAVGASNRTLILTAGGSSRRIVLSRLGRITW